MLVMLLLLLLSATAVAAGSIGLLGYEGVWIGGCIGAMEVHIHPSTVSSMPYPGLFWLSGVGMAIPGTTTETLWSIGSDIDDNSLIQLDLLVNVLCDFHVANGCCIITQEMNMRI